MIIRKAEKEDLVQISNLYAEVYSENPYNENWTEISKHKKIKELFYSGKVIIALEGKEVIGFIIYQKETHDTFQRFFIHDLGVKKEFRGKGVASKLLLIVENDARKEGVSELELNSNIHSKAYNIYKKKGFKETDWIVMSKEIK